MNLLLKTTQNFQTTAVAIFVLVAILISFTQCGRRASEPNEDVVARVNQEFLLKSDVEAIISGLFSSTDSAAMAQRFIDDWVKRQVFLSQAKENLSVSLSSFDDQVNQYRNSLIIYAFENQLVQENLDTLVTQSQLAEYYEKTMESFLLKEHIVRARFVKFPVELTSGITEFRRLIQSTNPADIAALEDFCINNSVAFYLDINRWLSFSDLLRDLPVNDVNPENFLRNNFLIELKDEYFKYFVYIFDHRRIGSIAPLSFEEENIRNLILIQRKKELLNKKRNQFLLEAKDTRMIEIF